MTSSPSEIITAYLDGLDRWMRRVLYLTNAFIIFACFFMMGFVAQWLMVPRYSVSIPQPPPPPMDWHRQSRAQYPSRCTSGNGWSLCWMEVVCNGSTK